MKRICRSYRKSDSRADVRYLLAQKAFSMYSCYPLIGEYLDGTTPVDYMKQNSGKNVWGKKIIYFLRHIGKMN